MKNKFIRTLSALLLTSCLVIGLSACGGNSTSNSSTESESAETVSESTETESENVEEAENSEQESESEAASDLNENGDPKLSSGDTREYWVGSDTMEVYCPAGFYEPEVWAGANMGDDARGHMKLFSWYYLGDSGNVDNYTNCPRVEFAKGNLDMSNDEASTVSEVVYGTRTFKRIESSDSIQIRNTADFSIDSLDIIGGEIPDNVITEILESLPME